MKNELHTPGFSFEVQATVGKARAGLLHTPRGTIETPVFMPVGTQGTVKAMTALELETGSIDAKIILGNTYHLYIRPGLEVLETHGGLHAFANWKRPILTDSGGFQVFSLGANTKIDEDGVTFRNHLSGDKIRFTPERSIEIQKVIGSDIAMVFDQCPPGDADKKTQVDAMRRTTAWAKRCLDAPRGIGQALFGIVQGGIDLELREQHLQEITAMNFDGIALGGLSVGEGTEAMNHVLENIAHMMPTQKPRYLMGVGTPSDLTQGVLSGIDMFDCVMPTRNARTGMLFTSKGPITIKNKKHEHALEPVDENCDCYTCKTVSRSYLRHLHKAKEMLYGRLATLHNLSFYANHMRRMRQAILRGEAPPSHLDPWQ